jgi:ABC-2 type transport system permease protein
LLGPSLTKLMTSLFFLLMATIEYRLFFGVNLVGSNLPLVFLILLLTIPSIYGIGVAFGSLVIRFQEASALVFLVRGIFMVFTGVSYPLAVLPGWMKTVAAGLPLTYTVRSLRAVALSDASLVEIWPDLRSLLAFGMLIPLLGYLSFRFVERRARRTGSLGQY